MALKTRQYPERNLIYIFSKSVFFFFLLSLNNFNSTRKTLLVLLLDSEIKALFFLKKETEREREKKKATQIHLRKVKKKFEML